MKTRLVVGDFDVVQTERVADLVCQQSTEDIEAGNDRAGVVIDCDVDAGDGK